MSEKVAVQIGLIPQTLAQSSINKEVSGLLKDLSGAVSAKLDK